MAYKPMRQTTGLKMDVPKSRKFNRDFFIEMASSVPAIVFPCMLSWSYYVYVFHLCYSALFATPHRPIAPKNYIYSVLGTTRLRQNKKRHFDEYVHCAVKLIKEIGTKVSTGHVSSLEVKILYLVVYHVILMFFLWSYFKTTFTEPRGAPAEFRLPEKLFEEYNREPLDLSRQRAILRDFSENLPITTCTSENDIRFCDKCRIVKPDRSHHCRKCLKCVLKMDHHCYVLFNCVSYSNYKSYILLLVYGLMMCLFVVSTTVAEYVIKLWHTNPAEITQKEYKMSIILLFIISVMISIISLLMLLYHIILISKNQTTYERIYSPIFLEDCDKNRFNLGCCRNIQEVFGKEVILWPFPIDTSLGEGVSFPTSRKESKDQRSLLSDVQDQETVIDMDCSDKLKLLNDTDTKN